MESLLQFDEQLYILINNNLSHPFWDALLIPLRHKLCWIPVYLFIISFILLNYGKKRWLTLFFLILTIVMSDTSSSKIIKKSVQRQRPCHVEELSPIQRIPCSYGYSFTSSHATNHFALSSFLFFLLAFWKWRVVLIIWAAVISFAQVYVGVHYPLDVTAGALLGFLIGFLSFKLYGLASQKLTFA